MQLNPRESFTIVRQLEDHTDTNTYYVRAVIRNAKTDTLLDTVNLTDRGSRRFSQSWTVPSDVSGQGFWVSILTSVYTDSGYTTKSGIYGDKMDTFLVQERQSFNPNYPIPTGPDIDYKRIQKMIDKAIERAIQSKPDKEVVVVTKEVVKEIKVPEVKIVESYKEPNLSPLMEEIRIVGKKVDDKPVTEVPEQEPVDLSPVLRGLDKVEKSVTSLSQKVESTTFEVQLNPKLGSAKKEPTPSPMMEDDRIKKLMKK